jgi:putative transposase
MESRGATACVAKVLPEESIMPSTHHGILIHTVFSTKNRKPMIDVEWQDDLYAYMGVTAREHKAIIVCSGGIEDHVHLLIKIHPAFAVSSTVQLIKANASRWVNEERLTRWNFEWQRGYGAFSVSQSRARRVKQYIHNQREHHQKQTFSDEYVEILQRHEIEYDPRYVFDEEIVA